MYHSKILIERILSLKKIRYMWGPQTVAKITADQKVFVQNSNDLKRSLTCTCDMYARPHAKLKNSNRKVL